MAAPRPSPASQDTLPTITDSEVTPSPRPAGGSSQPAGQVRTYTNPELGLTFSYLQGYTLVPVKKPATDSFPFLGYEFILSGSGGSFGFGAFKAPHPERDSLSSILNVEVAEAVSQGQQPATFTVIDPLGNSLESARFTSGSPSLYALRATDAVFYVYPLEVADAAANARQLTDQAVASFHFPTGK